VDPSDATPESPESMTALMMGHVLRWLISCDRLQYVVLELRASRSNSISALEAHLIREENLGLLHDADKQAERGVLLVREYTWDPWGRCIQSQAIYLPWWDREKTIHMKAVEEE
jgi:hypothetical protein